MYTLFGPRAGLTHTPPSERLPQVSWLFAFAAPLLRPLRPSLRRLRARLCTPAMSKGLENQLFQLKFTAKQMGRLSSKCLKEEKAEKEKIKKCLEKDNHDGARIHAQNAIRAKTNAQNYLRLSSRVDAVSSRLESAMKMQQVTKSMGMVVKGMDKVLGSMNVEAIGKVCRARQPGSRCSPHAPPSHRGPPSRARPSLDVRARARPRARPRARASGRLRP